MPRRKTPLISGQYYHIFNRGINRQPIFLSNHDYNRALTTLFFYRYSSLPMKLSHFLLQNANKQQSILTNLTSTQQIVEITAYCLMPNHFHLILKQILDNGISTFLSNFQNSYTKAFNAKHKRNSVLLDRQFKSVHIETEEQLLHLTRYLHLNPYSASIIPKNQILTYPWSSIQEFVSGNYKISNPNSTIDIKPKQYSPFVIDHADYQQKLEKIKHLTLEN